MRFGPDIGRKMPVDKVEVIIKFLFEAAKTLHVMKMRIIFTDVLIVGGGIAGLRAALSARRKADNVMMVSKGVPGKSGCSLISEGILNGPFSREDSPDLYYNDIIKGSGGVADPLLARTLADNARDAVLSLRDIGVNFLERDGGLVLDLSGGNSVARTVKIDPPGPGCGKAIPTALASVVGKSDIDMAIGYGVVKILKDEGRAVSAVAHNGDEFIQINFKAVVLATGGGGKLYRSTTNPKGIVGDGYFLAHDAGAPLVDMEYVQFFPTVALSSYLVLPFIFTDGAILLNSKGERFIGRYDPELMEMTTRDKMSQAIFSEDADGRGVEGGALMSCRDVPPSVLEEKYKAELDFFKKKGTDLRKESLPVRPACHFLMGGVKINNDCSTGVEGLYACGECAGGVHGANRLAGNALVETLVFGDIAGESAAEFARGHDHVEAEANDFIESLPKEFGTDGEDIIESLRELAWNRLGIVRDGDGIKGSIEELDDILKRLNSLPFSDLEQYFQTRNMAHVLRCIATSALAREESRGAHFRRDFPMTDPRWKAAISIKEEFKTTLEPR